MDIIPVSKIPDMLSLPHCKAGNGQIHPLCSWRCFFLLTPNFGTKAAENFLCWLLAILLD